MLSNVQSLSEQVHSREIMQDIIKQRSTTGYLSMFYLWGTFPNNRELYLHAETSHLQTRRGIKLQSSRPSAVEDDLNLKQVYEASRALILQNHQPDRVHNKFTENLQ